MTINITKHKAIKPFGEPLELVSHTANQFGLVTLCWLDTT